jgi:hypothetical protein
LKLQSLIAAAPELTSTTAIMRIRRQGKMRASRRSPRSGDKALEGGV